MLDGARTGIGFGRTLDRAFAETMEAVEAALAAEGFGILTRIDVQATLKAKLDREIPPYVILGACNPPLAHRALTAEPEVGLLLPCNVVVREVGPGRTRVEAMDPQLMVRMIPSPDLPAVANEAASRLRRALGSL